MITNIKIVSIIKAKYILAFHRPSTIRADVFIVSATKVAHCLENVRLADIELVDIKYSNLRHRKKRIN